MSSMEIDLLPAHLDAKEKELAITELTEKYVKEKNAQGIVNLTRAIRPFALSIPKARTSKIVRQLLESLDLIPDTNKIQIDLCRECIDWAVSEKRTFLRQRIEFRLATCLFAQKEFSKALTVTDTLGKELRKLDDKALLLEVQILESAIYFALLDLPRAKAALTAARTSSNSIYTPPKLQADIDTQSGIIMCEEKDYNTAFSYFFEAFETKHTLESRDAPTALKYMLLAKVLNKQPNEVPSVANGKNAVKYTGREVESMKKVALSYAKRDIAAFDEALKTYPEELVHDDIVHRHLSSLYDGLVIQNLMKLIEPFSRVQISHLAKLIKMDTLVVEQRLSQMILDGHLHGTLDQGAGDLIIFEESTRDVCYERGSELLSELNKVIDNLFDRASVLSA